MASSEAAELRRAGKLWPQTLTDEELRTDYALVLASGVPVPITMQMLRAELARRGLRP